MRRPVSSARAQTRWSLKRMRTHGMAGTMARRHRAFPVLPSMIVVAALAAAAAASCRGGCARAPDRAATVQGRLALFPVNTSVVVALDFARLRGSPAAAKLAALARQSQSDDKEIEELARRTGFDPI